MAYPYDNIPDHPVIRNTERTGYPDGKEPEYPHCPVCYEPETAEIYVRDGEPVGCEACVTRSAANDIPAFRNGSGDPVCPVCGKPCEDGYFDRDGDIIGCDVCVGTADAWERSECFHGRD